MSASCSFERFFSLFVTYLKLNKDKFLAFSNLTGDKKCLILEGDIYLYSCCVCCCLLEVKD